MLFFLLTSSFTNPACAGAEGADQPVEFQLYRGNESLPLPHQQVPTIRGKINADNIAITDNFRDRNGEVERRLELTGDEYRKSVEIVRNTRIKEKDAAGQPVGGGAFDVTLIDDKGQSDMGTPSNRGEWERFAAEMGQAARASVEQR